MSEDENNPTKPAGSGFSADDDRYLRYFDAEMRYLREAGREFARSQPQGARRVGMTMPGARHDSVEQTYEGFAFLASRLRMKLDDAAPEITDPLLDHLWPHTGRTIPSLTILECVPRSGEARVLDTLPPGLQVRSTPVGPDGTICVYRTTRAIHLLPLNVREAGARMREDGRTVIRLAFDLLHREQRLLDDLSRIRLYLHGDRPTASALYAVFTRQVESIGVRMPRLLDGQLQPRPAMTIEAAGFGAQARLWPTDLDVRDVDLDREQTMLEYFAFPEKFHFVDLCGFDAASVPPGETCLEFEIVIRDRIPGDATFGADNIRLFCTPVINLLELDAQAIRPNAHDRDYPVRAPTAAGEHIEPYDVLSVVATDPRTARQYPYQSIKAFRHRGGMMRHESPHRYYHASIRQGVTGQREMVVTLGGHPWEEPGSLPDGHVTVRVLANNGRLPRMALRESMVATPVSTFNGVERVRNLTAPTMPLYPPRGGDYDWRVISHFNGAGTTELNMMDANVLRGALSLYDWTRADDNRRRIDAIRHVWLDEETERVGARVDRIVNVNVGIEPSGFAGPGDVALFGDVLSRFVGRYACFHFVVRLVLYEGVGGPSRRYPCTIKTGDWL
ncbi:type VI secretion system ImpG/VasA family protein [Burkholderia sp. AU16741]|uniref:type VI secretion system baseplate subunit TssF n=1 Tax=unclassified Burkholderia TaxID=2613784 RepID=UPI000B7A9C75|nr:MULTISPECIES: type VI secretion system baseplate subunit TssF [unclassified Burkholderia]MDN7427521.1 type VI secretion system baseplate subunit TssF [Burkholderia sp. AU45388]OXI30365.1 type VI secretion system ImpG/VasA family protein [Burkholderia sp. AU16741]